MPPTSQNATKNVLILCYYFPPMGMGGTQRAAKFVKYLPLHGYNPIVVTVKQVIYHAHDDSLLDDVAKATIIRTESLDPLRLLARFRKTATAASSNKDSSFSRKGLLNWLNETVGAWLLVPDSKILWAPFAFIAAWKQIKLNKIAVVFTTSPPHSVHLIGAVLHALTGIRWVADFRDDWTGGESQPCPGRVHRWINRMMEKWVLRSANSVIGMCDALTDSLREKCQTQPQKFKTIMNGYDRDDFQPYLTIPSHDKFTITHCGSISRVSHPAPFLKAVKRCLDDKPEIAENLQIQFIGTDIYGNLQRLVNEFRLELHVPPIRYLAHHDAVRELMASHLLLLTIFKRTDEEIITGKVFEYLAAGKPILIISRDGYVARLIQRLKRGTVVEHNDIQQIMEAIVHYYQLHQAGKSPVAEPISLPEFDRFQQAGQLANIFNHNA